MEEWHFHGCTLVENLTLVKLEKKISFFRDFWYIINKGVIRQKGESQNGCFKKTKNTKFSEKTIISYLLIHTGTCAYQGGRKSENLACFVFLKYPFRDSPSCLITNEIRRGLTFYFFEKDQLTKTNSNKTKSIRSNYTRKTQTISLNPFSTNVPLM